ncbi:zinc-binding alcohol dehydrogenase family protein [uncultured Xylophilus sp.]|uniref:zinc-binding alcohol dehydrogenase family protein n=1 Tax=uncultured Xylophilus sp. TaxID=296832 RepID=UPI0025D883D6|nr:zinc-binding alcohol dehydrogenase family protein [uncultured Xylophilus sp.]
MKAIGYFHPLSIDHPDALLDIELPAPTIGPRDLLVRVHAVSVNPVDTKIRRGVTPEAGQAKVLGWDAVGVVEAVGQHVQHYGPGDRVYYAGSIARTGTNAELHAVDERIVGRAPVRLDDGQAAALPLTAITAWELLFERLGIREGGGAGERLLIVGGAGGVGSMLIQLARQLTQLEVIATASRPETREWCLDLGAHAVIDHTRPLAGELAAAGRAPVHYVASLTQTDQHYEQIIECLRPQGRLGLIDDPAVPLDVMKLKRKSISMHWELMFTRSLFETEDIDQQRLLLNRVADLVDERRLRTTLAEHLGTVNASNLRRAHALVESGKVRGKVVLEGF